LLDIFNKLERSERFLMTVDIQLMEGDG